MCRLRSTVIGVIFVLLVSATVVGDCDQTASPPGPATVARFPGTLYRVLPNIDGSAVCCTTKGVFWSVKDMHDWSAVPKLPRESNNFCFQPVGGDRSRFFVEDRMAGAKRLMAEHPRESVVCGVDYSLDAVNADGTVCVVREKMPSGLCAFASKDVGVIAWSEDTRGLASVNNNLLLTIDGGRTWNLLPQQGLGTKVEYIANLLWVTTSRLLIAGTEGSVQVFDRKEDSTLRRGWSSTISGYSGRHSLTLDGDYVWINQDKQASRLRLADGHLNATVKVNAPETKIGGMYDWSSAAYHHYLVVWGMDRVCTLRKQNGLDGFKTMEEANAAFMKEEAVNAPKPQIDVWANDPKKGYVRRARIATPRIAAVLPLEAPLCLVITTEGEGLHLDVDKGILSPVALKVTPLPPEPVTVDPRFASPEQLQTMNTLAEQVPRSDRNAIFEAVNKRTDLTPKQLVELATKQLREYIETKRPGPIVEPPSATVEEQRTMMELGNQIPVADRLSIMDQAAKNSEGRDYVLRLIQLYRQYLEQHKSKPVEKKRSAGEKSSEESSEKAGKE